MPSFYQSIGKETRLAAARLQIESLYAGVLALALALSLATRWAKIPATPLVGDEEAFYRLARTASQEGRLASHALLGTRGSWYGPGVVWLYQLWFRFAADLHTMRLLQCAWNTLFLVLGILLIARSFKGCLKWYDPLLFLCVPSFWYFDRTLWDNPLLISYSALAVGAYLNFIRFQNSRWLIPCAVACGAMLNVHLMAASCVLAIAVHAILFQRSALRAAPAVCVAAAGICLLLLLPYLTFFVSHPAPALTPVLPPRKEIGEFFATGYKALSVFGITKIFGTAFYRSLPWSLRPWFWISALGGGATFFFGLLGLWAATDIVRRSSRDSFTAQLAWLCLLLLGVELGVQFFYARVPTMVHYHNATWLGYALTVILAWYRFSGHRAMAWARCVYASSLATSIWLLYQCC